jgi:hypothetical protein
VSLYSACLKLLMRDPDFVSGPGLEEHETPYIYVHQTTPLVFLFTLYLLNFAFCISQLHLESSLLDSEFCMPQLQLVALTLGLSSHDCKKVKF